MTEALLEDVPECLGHLWDDTDVADDAHEVRVARPARHYVTMQVAGNACASSGTEVDADVETLRVHDVSKQLDDADSLRMQVCRLVSREMFEFGDVASRGDHDVAAGVGEAVDDTDAVIADANDQPASHGGRSLLAQLGNSDVDVGGSTEETPGEPIGERIATDWVLFERSDILHPPGRMELFASGGHATA